MFLRILKYFKILRLFFFLPVISFSLPCINTYASNNKIIEGVVAVVMGKPILYSETKDFQRILNLSNDSYKSSLNTALNYLVELEILKDKLEKIGIKTEDDEINFQIKALAQSNGNKSVDDFLLSIKKKGISEAVFRKFVKYQILKAKYIRNYIQPNITISEQELKQDLKKIVGKEIKLFNMLLISSKNKNKLLSVYKKIDFQKKDAIQQNLNKYKNLKVITLKGISEEDINPTVRKHLQTLKPGEFSEIFQLGDSYFFVYFIGYAHLEDTDELTKKKLANFIIMKKIEEEFKTKMSNLKNQYYVEIKKNLIKKLEEGK